MARKKAEQETELLFEEAMQRLEEVVRQLEEGDVPLEKAIDLYQEGIQLSRQCATKLDVIEAKVIQLLDQDGSVSDRPFHVEED
ncbi:exodeoxyribonuclease VII small subunit [Brevibacillus laterosporus]|uniref:Exodeoxyribonuclease 7 small subunit n=1 Tax=Brevibacillus laterosporus TaxID=1465 RepID=A0AAP3GDS7_BRELA|nr:exodeoxyribonuclease VII small subunit [Brevibacillus laterosporus]ATO50959.1 exodeoxyribonuclease VII small subunit [Brevibacillus laterosporus DSM 25]AYB38827.1 exodeoxyribonuclease VII small subunit [Brevibacillus laterosporus]MBG9774290.1 exodeoxyribonuclease VII small subunit [Brevibacillus laterosporus]MBG9796535.1 exodeoxyribonuclease VII small subunit [Brevibacillus laterosporus]MBG9802433.1 exodeoxyribonuclease VII small subunit [Brevibacillus laterosporus]